MKMRFLIVPRGYFCRFLLSDGYCGCQCQGVLGGSNFQLSSWTSVNRRYRSTWMSSFLSVGRGTTFKSSDVVSTQFSRRSSSFRDQELHSSGTRYATSKEEEALTGKELKELKKIKQGKQSSTVFYDSLRLFVKGGMGGQGFPRKGGMGGKGGDVIAIGHKDVTLKKITNLKDAKQLFAETGADSKLFCLNGIPGKNKILPVPLGVSIITELGHKIGEINKHGETLVVAKGGAGGSPSNGYSAEKGQAHHVTLDLKLIADVGFVGFPNAGKSTLLKALSRASPKIASYPFTTVRPNIGVIEYPDFRQISLADLPGLIEGAHVNVGMGHKFLKHVERTKVLLFVVDIHGFQLSPKYPYRSALETIVLLNKELELYKEELTETPAVLALNKSDLPGSYTIVKEINDIVSDQHSYEAYLKTLPSEIVPENVLMFDKVIAISAKTDPISVNQLKQVIRQTIDINASESAVAIV